MNKAAAECLNSAVWPDTKKTIQSCTVMGFLGLTSTTAEAEFMKVQFQSGFWA
jgi:hypothetical protein